MTALRRLVYTFLRLPQYRKLQVAQELGFLDDRNDYATDQDFYRSVFRRSREHGKVAQLQQLVDQHLEELA
mgnify:CR=1 FL=1